MPKRYCSRPFRCRRVNMSPGVRAALKEEGEEIIYLLVDHISGKWGDISDAERATNEASLDDGTDRYRPRPVVSRHTTSKGTQIFVNTDWGRRAINVRLADEK